MNAEQKKRIEDVIATVRSVFTVLEEAASTVEEVRDEEQSTFDDLSEKAQEGTKGTALQETIDALTSAVDSLADIDLESILTDLETARGDIVA